MTLAVGQKAPDFDVTSSSGKSLKLSEMLGKKNVVLYFYPGDFTLVCTRETCGFRDAFEELASKDTEVIGISVDSNESHEKFAKEYNVPFSLVSDENRALAKEWLRAPSIARLIVGEGGNGPALHSRHAHHAREVKSAHLSEPTVEGTTLLLECTPAGGQDQAADLPICRACPCSNLTGLRYPSAEWSRRSL